jgi:hypothetical protein
MAAPSWDVDPVGALDALRRGWVIAQDSGIRCNQSYLAANLARLEARHGDQVAALDYLTLTIDNYRHAGNIPAVLSPAGDPPYKTNSLTNAIVGCQLVCMLLLECIVGMVARRRRRNHDPSRGDLLSLV